MKRRRIIVALTGASGAVYGRRMLEVLSGEPFEIRLCVSEGARQVIRHELGLEMDLSSADSVARSLGLEPGRAIYHPNDHLAAPIASGSFRTEGMVVIPCSMGTLGRIATGVSGSLIERAADVCLKERRRLVLVTRETPLSEIHLENMLRVTRAGAVVMPASPGFYGDESNVESLIDFVVGRALDHLGVEHRLTRRYGEPQAAGRHPERELSEE